MADAPAGTTRPLTASEEALRAHALTYPEVTEDTPWGHLALKVRKKAFVFLGCEGERLTMTVKLTVSHMEALQEPFAAPAGYGLGKSGWVRVDLPLDGEAPLGLLKEWIDESYRAVAPKALAKRLSDQ